MKLNTVIVLLLPFTLAGVAAGFILARQTGWLMGDQAGSHAGHAHTADGGHPPAGGGGGHAGHGHSAAAEPVELSPATLKNLGVEYGRLELTSFVRHRSVPAVVESRPLNDQPVYAPIGGRVTEVHVELGVVVKPGEVLATLVRDPLPRPELILTSAVLKPAQEALHDVVVRLRTSHREREIVKTELERVKRYTNKNGQDALPVLPKQREIDLQYELLRTDQSCEAARHELAKHGLSDEEVEEIAGGGHIPSLTQTHWKQALRINGLWTADAEKLHAVLSESQQALPWVIATVGELTASGLNQPELVRWLATVPEDCQHFLEIGALLQRGHSVAGLRRLHELHAFDPIVRIVAPPGPPDWNVKAIHIRPGAHVDAGNVLIGLSSPRTMYLRLNPVGGEEATLLQALADGATCEAVPLVDGSGPELTGVRLTFAAGDSMESSTALFYAEVENTPLTVTKREDGRGQRTWRLRHGLRYVVRVPTEVQTNVFVLPSGAIATDGPNQVIYRPDGELFESIPVHVSYQDERVAVLPMDETMRLPPGAQVVIKGAFPLSLALQSGRTEVDAHGHQH